jgi:hypothetical protein
MITSQFQGKVLVTGGEVVDVDVEIELAFDEENDPLAVTMIISVPDEGEVVWEFSRELLRVGSQSIVPHGGGDVRFRAVGDNWPQSGLIACLHNGDDHADLGLPLDRVRHFLAATECAIDDTLISAHLDDALKEILGS